MWRHRQFWLCDLTALDHFEVQLFLSFLFFINFLGVLLRPRSTSSTVDPEASASVTSLMSIVFS
jgi:hypothetical protein